MATVLAVSPFLQNAGRLGVLAVPVLLGVLTVRTRLIRDASSAIEALNVYTLHVGFPALIAAGVVAVDPAIAGDWAFWVLVPAVDLVLVGAAALLGRVIGTERPAGSLPAERPAGSLPAERPAGSMALVCLFGNTAYLGIPFVVSVFGAAARGPAALLVAVQVSIAVAVGPVLLARWSGDGERRVDWGRLLAQPLLWAPLLGVAVRALPSGAAGAASDVLAPLAASVAPVAMFLLGVYLASTTTSLGRPDASTWAHVGLRMVVAPLATLAVGALLVAAGMDRSVLPVAVVLGGMPAAISTFSLAYDVGVAADRVAAVVVWSSVASVPLLPVLASLAERLV